MMSVGSDGESCLREDMTQCESGRAGYKNNKVPVVLLNGEIHRAEGRRVE
jgi:hypothetical protein